LNKLKTTTELEFSSMKRTEIRGPFSEFLIDFFNDKNDYCYMGMIGLTHLLYLLFFHKKKLNRAVKIRKSNDIENNIIEVQNLSKNYAIKQELEIISETVKEPEIKAQVNTSEPKANSFFCKCGPGRCIGNCSCRIAGRPCNDLCHKNLDHTVCQNPNGLLVNNKKI